MDTKNCTLLILTVLVLLASTPTRACSCEDWHLQSYFCGFPIVVRAEFLSIPDDNNSTEDGESEKLPNGYNVKLKEVYRGGDWSQDVISITTMFGTACEYKPESSNYNVDNLIIGLKHGDDLYVDSCCFIRPWNELSPKQILGIKGAYTSSCNCKLISCRYMEPCAKTVNECVFQRSVGDFRNQDRNQTCCRNENGICHWQTIVDHMDEHESPSASIQSRTNSKTKFSRTPLH